MRLQITAYRSGEVLGSGSYSQKRIPRVKIGSAENMHLRVEDPGIAEEHTEIYILDGKAYARPLGVATVWLNDIEIEDESELNKDDRLKLSDEIEFTAEVTAARKESKGSKKHKKTKTKVNPKGGRISFNKFTEVAGETDDDRDERPVEKLKKKEEEEEEEEAEEEESEEGIKLRRFTLLDFVKVVLILIMVIFLFGKIIIPTIKKLMVS